MDSTQTAQTPANSAQSTSPFDQIRELERRENERVETELSAMQKEKEEVSASVSKKEEQAMDELKTAAKKDLKEYSETELASIVATAKNEAGSECESLKSSSTNKKADAVKMLVEKAKDPATYSLSA